MENGGVAPGSAGQYSTSTPAPHWALRQWTRWHIQPPSGQRHTHSVRAAGDRGRSRTRIGPCLYFVTLRPPSAFEKPRTCWRPATCRIDESQTVRLHPRWSGSPSARVHFHPAEAGVSCCEMPEGPDAGSRPASGVVIAATRRVTPKSHARSMSPPRRKLPFSSMLMNPTAHEVSVRAASRASDSPARWVATRRIASLDVMFISGLAVGVPGPGVITSWKAAGRSLPNLRSPASNSTAVSEGSTRAGRRRRPAPTRGSPDRSACPGCRRPSCAGRPAPAAYPGPVRRGGGGPCWRPGRSADQPDFFLVAQRRLAEPAPS